MLKLFLISCARFARLWFHAWSGAGSVSRTWLKRLMLLLLWPFFVAVQLMHWLGFLIDEVLFRGYRQVEVHEPIFVVGPPRSGTTHLHYVLSEDPDTTTFATWECLFGLSVSAKKGCMLLTAMDRVVGRPIARLIRCVELHLLSDMQDVHPFSLNAPEEDFLSFLPLAQCFILVVVFPRADWLWKTARLDIECTNAEKKQWLAWYHACVQKHLYVFGTEKTFLSKNASFSGSVQTLFNAYPDASVMVCSRDPIKTVPSQLSSIQPGAQAIGFSELESVFQDQLIDLLEFYYLHLCDMAQAYPDQMAFIDNGALRGNLNNAVLNAMDHLKRTGSDTFKERLIQLDQSSRTFNSGHRYSLEDFGLTEAAVKRRFARVYQLYQFNSQGLVLK